MSGEMRKIFYNRYCLSFIPYSLNPNNHEPIYFPVARICFVDFGAFPACSGGAEGEEVERDSVYC